MEPVINLDFCIIDNPINKEDAPIIFVTRKNENFLDETVVHGEDYEKAVNIIQNFGYVQSEILIFECMKMPNFPIIKKESIIEILSKNGMKYNKKLEKNINEDFLNFKKKVEVDFNNKGFVDTYNNNVLNTKKVKIPEIGHEITLYFNLFLECKFINGLPYLYMSGDFNTNKTTDTKNFFRPIKVSFMRVPNDKKNNKIILKSSKTIKQLWKELSVVQSGAFFLEEAVSENNQKNQPPTHIQRKTFVYSFLEIKNNLPGDSRITLEASNDDRFNVMHAFSNKIKEEYRRWNEFPVNMAQRYEDALSIEKVLEEKMMSLSEKEEFGKAAAIKRELAQIRKKKKLIYKCITQTMSESEFIKKFHIE